jgi:polysaccharide biosynthesis protein PslH
MAMGIPCITTTLVNNAIDAAVGEAILIADDAIAFANTVLTTIENKPLKQKIANNALYFVKKRYSWQHYGQKLTNLLSQIS